MQAFFRWAAARAGATVLAASIAAFIGIQIAGYGTDSAALDVACTLMLVGIAGVFHFQFMDGIAQLEKQTSAYAVDPRKSARRRITVAVTGACAFLFSALSIVMRVRVLGR